MRPILLLLCVQAVFFTGFTFSQTSSPAATPSLQTVALPSPQEPAPQALTSNSPTITKSDTEVMILREQNKLIRDYQDSLLSTVYWSLGGVFALALLLAGFGWWSNFKLYENDKNRLQQDLNSKIHELDTAVALKIETHRGELERVLETKNDITLNRLLSETSAVRDQFTKMCNETAKELKQFKATDESLQKGMSEADKSIARTESDLRQVEEHIWELKKIPGNVLITQGQCLKSALAAQNPYRVQSVLARMKSTISVEIISKGVTLRKKTFEIVDRRLEAAIKQSETDSVKIAEIQDLLRKVPIKED